MFTTAIGALLGGVTSEAHTVEQERFEREQFQTRLAHDTLTHLIDDPNIGNPAIKEEALQELQGRLMGQLHPDNYNHKPGKLGKLVDQFVGMQQAPAGPLGHPIQSAAPSGQAQPGVGRGNATSQVGAAQPQMGDPSAQPAQSVQGGPPQPSFSMSSPPVAMAQDLIPTPQDPTQDLIASGEISQNGRFQSPHATQAIANYQADLANVRKTNLDVATERVKNRVAYDDKLDEWLKQRTDPRSPYSKMDDSDPFLLQAFERHMSGLATPVGFLKQAEAKDQIPYEKALQEAKSLGISLPEGAGPGDYLRRKQVLGATKAFEIAEPPRPMLVSSAMDSNSPSGQATQIRDRAGNIISSVPTVPSYANQVMETLQTHSQVLPDGTIIQLQNTTERGPQSKLGGFKNAKEATANGYTVKGNVNDIFKANGQYPLTAAGQEVMATTMPTFNMVQRIKSALEQPGPDGKAMKDSNVPLGTFLDTLLYKAGIETDKSGFIAQNELNKVIGSARVMKGASRALPALMLAMQHLPNVQIDSGKLMYDKLTNVEQNLNDIMEDAKQYERKFGTVPTPQGATSGKSLIQPGGALEKLLNSNKK